VYCLVVGLGSIGQRHARNWRALGLGELRAAREFPSLEAALATQPDVVLVTNPTSLHVATARQAVQAGAHVLVEKPLGHSLDGVCELLDEARQRQRVLCVGYNLRCHPGLARLREIVQTGGIGRPLVARAEMGEYLPDWHPWEDYRQSYSARRDLGGGPVLTLSHELDALCWVLGRPRRIAGMAAHTSSLEVDTEDAAELTLLFESGALGSVHVDYVRRAPRRLLEVTGEQGIVRWEYDTNCLLRYAPGTREWRVEEGDPAFTRNAMYLAELWQFARWVTDHVRGPLANGEQGAAILGLALAGLRAAAEGCTTRLEDEGEPLRTWLAQL
jgi:predicted dehydrogenase